MASYGVLEEHTILDPDFSILAFAFCWACGLSWNEAWANVKSSLLDITMPDSIPAFYFKMHPLVSQEPSDFYSLDMWRYLVVDSFETFLKRTKIEYFAHLVHYP
jgi:hypothetical protein